MTNSKKKNIRRTKFSNYNHISGIVIILILACSLLSGCISGDDGDGSGADIDNGTISTTIPPTTTPTPTTAAPMTTTPAATNPPLTVPPATTAAPTTPAPTTAAPVSPHIEVDFYDISELSGEIYKDPIIYEGSLYYVVEISKETPTYWGEYILYKYDIGSGNETDDVYYGDDLIRLFPHGSLYVPVDDNDYFGYIVDLDTLVQKDLSLKAIVDYHDGWGSYILQTGSYKQVYTRDLETGKSYLITDTPSNKKTPAIYGNNVVYTEYISSWDLMIANKIGGSETILSNFDGDEVNPKIYGNYILYGLEDGGTTALCYMDLTNKISYKICDNVGNYYNYYNTILYYDMDRGQWILGNMSGSKILKFLFNSYNENAPAALSSDFVFIDSTLYEYEVIR